MRFWDSSALVPLLVAQARSEGMRDLFKRDAWITVWWAAVVECTSAVTRLEREGKLTEHETEETLARLEQLARAWSEVLPSPIVRQTARRLLRTHPLRAADALQLAAALALTEPHAPKPEFVCLDDRLATAARKEGFPVLGVEPARAAAD